MKHSLLRAQLSTAALLLASCSLSSAGDSATGLHTADRDNPEFEVTEMASFDEPWAMAFDEGSGMLFVTERAGRIKFMGPGQKLGTVTGVPEVSYGGQGGLGDIAFLPAPPRRVLDRRTLYLSWAEPGSGGTSGAAVGRGELVCEEADSCTLSDLRVIWRQQPKVTGQGHYSHRIAFSPDGKFLYIASGDRQKMQPAQDPASDLGKIIRIPVDASGRPSAPAERYSLGHRNILGLRFDNQGRLWDLEHGPRGGDELNLVEPGRNFGWPLVSDGDHYDGKAIPRHASRPDFAAPAISWNPVIGPGNFVFYKGSEFAEWRGQAIIGGLVSRGLVRVAIEGNRAREVARIDLGARIRDIAEKQDGTLWVLTDGSPGKLLYLHKPHVLAGQ